MDQLAPLPDPNSARVALRAHAAIGWDFDNTLVDHPASPHLHALIRATPRLRHVIVTFRSHGMQNDIWDDLARYPGAPAPEAFTAIVNIGDAAFDAYSMGRLRHRATALILPNDPDEIFYKEWKGRMCAEHGLTALVDDMTEMVAPGCTKYGIALFHPDQFI